MAKQPNISKAVVRIHIPEGVFKKARASAKVDYPNETYGVFLGVTKGYDIYVSGIVIPPEKEVWRSHAKVQVTERWIKHVQKHHEDAIVGDFHSHPYDHDSGEVSGPYPSEADVKHAVQFQQFYCPEYSFYVIFAVGMYRKHLKTRYEHYLLAKEPILLLEKAQNGE